LAGVMLMQGTTPTGPIFVEGQPVTGLPTFRKQRAIGPAYFETMGSRVVAGRAFAWADVHQRARIAVVSENLAREYWGEPSNAIGKRIRGGPNGNWSEIVGVSGNERDDGLNQPAPAIVFWPMARASREITYIVRSSRVQVPGFLRELQDAVWAVNKNVPLANARTLGEIEARSISQTSFAMVMLAISAGVALLLGVVGIYGVIRYIVAQRTREIGIRMALGAQAGDVRLLFLRHGLVLTMAGIAIGIGGAIVLSRVMTSLLFGVAPTDPFTYVAASVGLGAVAVLATYLPARRASATDPIVVLRADT
jgi:putative ABC transport system permease protein